MKLVLLATLMVRIINDAFQPSNITVAPGTQIQFVNRDDDAHTVTSVNGLFDSKGLDTNDTWTLKLQKPGVYKFFCQLHPFMRGTITVKVAKP